MKENRSRVLIFHIIFLLSQQQQQYVLNLTSTSKKSVVKRYGAIYRLIVHKQFPASLRGTHVPNTSPQTRVFLPPAGIISALFSLLF